MVVVERCFEDFEKLWLQIPKEERTELFQEWMDTDGCIWDLIRKYENKKI